MSAVGCPLPATAGEGRLPLLAARPRTVDRRATSDAWRGAIAALLSRVVRDQGRDDKAMKLSRAAEAASAEDDVESQALWRSIRAPIIARSGALAEAESLARSAVELARTTDAPQAKADTLSELASVLIMAGRTDEARRTLGEAIATYRAKGDVVSAARATARAAGLG